MEPMKNTFLVLGFFALLGIFIFEVLKTQEERKNVFIDPTIKNNTAIKTQATLSNFKNGFPYTKTWVILWYNIPSYLNPYVKHSKMKKCEHIGSNCVISTDNSDINNSSVVIFTHSSLPGSPPLKNKFQIWMFNTLENKAFTHRPNTAWKNQFEWIMSYRRDADVQRPYGKIIRLDKSLEKNYSEIFRQKTKFGAWMSGHCPVPSRRKEYIEQLQKYMPIDTFGSCGKKKCGIRTNLKNDCLTNLAREYKFYFSFENNICKDYSTEKVFNLYKNDFNLSIIPVVNGPPQASEYLPTGTFLSTLNYTSPEVLAKKLKEIGSSEILYTKYLKEKDKYNSLDEPEIFREAICNVCQKLDKMEGDKILPKADVMDMFKNDC